MMASEVLELFEASEETFDFTCSVCRKKNRVSEAVNHCQDSNKDLCFSCLDQHNNFMDSHTIVEPSDSGCGVVMPTEKCRRHGQKMIELWCQKHNEVLCNTCAFMDHRSCEEVKFIPGDIEQLLQNSELQETIEGLKISREQLASLKKERSLAGEELLKEKEKYLEMVEQQKRKIIKIVVSLEKASKEEINVWYNEKKKRIDESQDCCDQLERDTLSCLEELDTPSDNKPQLFVSLKKGQKVLATTKEATNERNAQPKPDKVYKMDNDMERFLVALQSMGSFKTGNTLYKSTGISLIRVKVLGDKNVCSIYASCPLSDGAILMTDLSNKRLKRLHSTTYCVTDYCDLPELPQGVCCVGPEEVAVCLPQKIQFVSVGKKMGHLTRSFNLDHECDGIAYSDGKLFVCKNDKVYVYSLLGTLLQTISHTSSGDAIFSHSCDVTVSEDKIYVADRYNGLICIDRKGELLFRYTGDGCYRVCTDGRDGVFVCGYHHSVVRQIGDDGKEMGVVLTWVHRLSYPSSMYFDSSNQKLIVANDYADDIMIYDLV